VPYLVRSASLTGFSEVAGSLGLDPRRLLQDVGIDPSCLYQSDRRIPALSLVLLLENAAAAAGVADFGLRMAAYRRLSNLGPLALLVQNETTLRGALKIIEAHGTMHTDTLVLLVEEHGGLASVREEHQLGEGAITQQVTQLWMASLHRIFRFLMGPAWRAHQVCFRQQAPRATALFRSTFGMPVSFGCSVDAIVCKSSDLDQPLPQADVLLARYASEFVNTSAPTLRPSVAQKVRQMVWVTLPQGSCSQERIAAQLGIDRTTLHRQLARHGEKFSSIVDAVRREKAVGHLLNDDLPLGEVAQLLGFSCLPSFSRWFTAHFGCSASSWRRNGLRREPDGNASSAS